MTARFLLPGSVLYFIGKQFKGKVQRQKCYQSNQYHSTTATLPFSIVSPRKLRWKKLLHCTTHGIWFCALDNELTRFAYLEVDYILSKCTDRKCKLKATKRFFSNLSAKLTRYLLPFFWVPILSSLSFCLMPDVTREGEERLFFYKMQKSHSRGWEQKVNSRCLIGCGQRRLRSQACPLKLAFSYLYKSECPWRSYESVMA